MSEPAAGPNLGLVSGYATGTTNWGTAMNLNLRTLDALGFFMVRVAPLGAPPSSPAQGDRYIIAPGATGAWAGHDNALTVWTTDETNTALWDFFTPQDGWTAKLVPSSGSAPIQVYTFRAGAWNITVSDIPAFSASGTGHMAGLVPDPGATAGVTRFLREDATWDVPSAGTSGGGGSAWELSDGTHTVTGVTEVVVSGAVVSSSGTTSTVATLTIAGGGGGSVSAPACFPGVGEAFNWSTGQWKRPALSAMTVFFPASNAATITEIGSGLSGPIKYLNGNNTVIPILGQAPPSSGPWTATALIETLAFDNQGSFVGIIAVDASNNALLSFINGGTSPPTINLQSGHLSVSGTGTAQSATYPFASSIATANLYMTPMLLWIRLRYDGTVYWSEISHDGDIWQGYDSGGTVGSLTGPAVIVGLTSTALTVNYFKLYSFSIVSGGTVAPDGTY